MNVATDHYVYELRRECEDGKFRVIDLVYVSAPTILDAVRAVVGLDPARTVVGVRRLGKLTPTPTFAGGDEIVPPPLPPDASRPAPTPIRKRPRGIGG